MDGLTWLIISWIVVGALCYLMLTKLGAPQPEVNTQANITTTPLTSSSGKWSVEERPEWLNDIIAWLFNSVHRVPDTLQAWIAAMNDAAKKVSSPGKCEVLFEGFGDNKNVTKAPRITNIRLQQAPNEHLIVRSNISVPEMNLKLVSSQRTDDRLLVTNYDAKINDLHGEIEARLACIANQVYVMACFCGRPELDIQLTNRDSSPAGAVSPTLVDEVIRKCLLSAVVNISLTEAAGQRGTTGAVTTPPGVFSAIPRPVVPVGGGQTAPTATGGGGSPTSPVAAPVQEMMKRISQSTQLANQVAKLQGTPNRVRVKVIRAQRLGGDRSTNFSPSCSKKNRIRCFRPSISTTADGCQLRRRSASSVASAWSSWHALALLHQIRNKKKHWLPELPVIPGAVNQPYVVLEMDEPAQKFQTNRGLNMSPYWEESFDFVLTPASEEILFEIYEGESEHPPKHGEPEDDRFLGLAIVGLEEMRRSNTDTAHTLKLQGRPYRNDTITGNLTVQFDFYHDPAMASVGKQVDQTIIRNNADQFRETVSSTRRPIYDPRDSFGAYDAQDVVTTKTTTVTVKTVKQQSPGDKPQPQPATSGVTVQQQQPATTIARPQMLLQEQQPQTGQKPEHIGAASMQYDTKGQPVGVSGLQQQQHVTYGTTAQQQPAGYSGQPQQQYTSTTTATTTTTTTATTTTTMMTQQQQPGGAATKAQQQHAVPGSVSTTATDKTAQHFLVGSKGQQQQATDTSSYPQQRYQQQLQQDASPAVTSKTEVTEIITAEETDEMRQSRGREKKRDGEKPAGKRDRSFFSELRDRLSGKRRRSKRRAKSCDIATGELEEAVSLPPSRDPSRTRFSERPGSRSHDSASYGGKSERSTKSLYQHSTLLLEVREKNGRYRYYLIPPSILDEPAAMKLLHEGKKLHVHNDHTFVAVKAGSGTMCNVCHQRIGRSSFSKQAYQCRDCRLVCHKPCHYKTEAYCTTSTVNKLNITKDVDWAHFLTSYQVDEFISEDGV